MKMNIEFRIGRSRYSDTEVDDVITRQMTKNEFPFFNFSTWSPQRLREDNIVYYSKYLVLQTQRSSKGTKHMVHTDVSQ